MIHRIEIGGYKLLSDFAADLRPLTVVIGANASGKSTLIDCLQMIRECCNNPLDDAFRWHSGVSLFTAKVGDGKLTWKIDFSKPDSTFWRDLPVKKENPLRYEVVLMADAQGRLMRPQYEVLQNQYPASGHEKPLKYLEATPYRRQISV